MSQRQAVGGGEQSALTSVAIGMWKILSASVNERLRARGTLAGCLSIFFNRNNLSASTDQSASPSQALMKILHGS